MGKLINDRFPRSNAYHPDWVMGRGSGGANALWLTEWLAEALPLTPGMKVLDLGCGRAMSSIFLHREFRVQVWATDLWFSAEDNARCIHDAGADGGVFPIHAEAHALPFAAEFFDAIVSIDSYHYYGTDDTYAHYVASFVKPGGALAIASAGLTTEYDGEVPPALRGWWEPNMASLHSAAWWRTHWQRSGILEVSHADSLEDAWQLWLTWQETAFPDNRAEIEALERDRGEHLTYVRAISRRRLDAAVPAPLTHVPTTYVRHPLLRGEGQGSAADRGGALP
jgi:cyclopropane fatty-acyl-phospholipid synthase-like methyltransferase